MYTCTLYASQEKIILTTTPLKTYRNKSNFVEATRLLSENAYSILNECETCSSDEIVDIIYKNIDCTLKKIKIAEHMNLRNTHSNIMEECDSTFRDYLVLLRTQNSSPGELKDAYSTYRSKRCLLNKDLALKNQKEYKYVIDSNDDRKLWNMIDWSGKVKNSEINEHPSMFEMSDFFTELYEPIHNDGDLNLLESNIYIPLTDDPISIDDVTSCAKQLKKGGFDYPIEVIKLVIRSIPAVSLLLLNMILYNSWPSKLCTSLLALIPKTGDLRLPNNYRGIQIQPLFSSLFDKITSNRLIMWTKVNDEQTAFQKGKGTLNQIFILSCITALAKYNKITLYIGFFDLPKPLIGFLGICY